MKTIRNIFEKICDAFKDMFSIINNVKVTEKHMLINKKLNPSNIWFSNLHIFKYKYIPVFKRNKPYHRRKY